MALKQKEAVLLELAYLEGQLDNLEKCALDTELVEIREELKQEGYDVFVELGLQTSSDATAEVINRGYKTEVFDRAVDILHSHDIPVVAHIIIGLPGESEAEALATAEHLAKKALFGVKIHSIYVMEGTSLADMYARGEYTPPSLDEYAKIAAKALAVIPADTVIHRLTGDCPRDMLIAPEWNADKHKIIEKIKEHMEENALKQGVHYKKPSAE